jgi:lipoprotein-releasing system ATP-binding protein
MKLLEAQDIHKRYDSGAQAVEVLRGVNISIDEGALVGVYGASGAGKSTLLHVLGGLDQPTEGSIAFMGQELSGMREGELARVRNVNLGFVFQFYHLLGEFTAVENVMIPCMIAGDRKGKAKRRSLEALERVGLAHRSLHRPAELSGGEQQRVAIARAAVMQPRLILADEPTGNLDRETGERVWDYLLKLNRDSGIGMIVVSHNHELLGDVSKLYELKDGKIEAETRD